MAIATDTTTSTPFAKFVNLGDQLIGAFAGGKSRQRINFDTKAPIFKPDGRPSLEEVMWLVVMPGTTAVTGDIQNGNPDPLADGAHTRFAVAGFKWGQIIQARKELPAANGFKAGQACSGDVYTITLSGWSAETKNPAAATSAGFTVVDGRIVISSQEEKDRYVLAQSRSGGNTNPAKDYTVTIRRPQPGEKAWEQAADELYLTKPWERSDTAVDPGETAAAGAAGGYDPSDEPF